MATFAIGDVQGCFRPLRQLLDKIDYDRARDQLWFVGDLVNRGPASLETLRFVKSLGSGAVTVLGNHDLHLLCVAEGFERLRRSDTLDAVLAAPDREELLSWLRGLPMMHRAGDYSMVHAGLLPNWSVEHALALAHEVETALRGANYREFLENMYGDEPRVWRNELRGYARLRAITNAMTRLRICTVTGEMDFRHKGDPGTAPGGYFPWYEIPGRKSRGKPIICGHWSAVGLRLTCDLLALDTGCLWGGSMTAVRLEDGQVFQVSCAELAKGRRRT